MPPEPEGCVIHPAALFAAGAGGAALWFLSFPALRWLCIHVDALISEMIR